MREKLYIFARKIVLADLFSLSLFFFVFVSFLNHNQRKKNQIKIKFKFFFSLFQTITQITNETKKYIQDGKQQTCKSYTHSFVDYSMAFGNF